MQRIVSHLFKGCRWYTSLVKLGIFQIFNTLGPQGSQLLPWLQKGRERERTVGLNYRHRTKWLLCLIKPFRIPDVTYRTLYKLLDYHRGWKVNCKWLILHALESASPLLSPLKWYWEWQKGQSAARWNILLSGILLSIFFLVHLVQNLYTGSLCIAL